MNTEPETSRWYYAQDGQAIGPLPPSGIRALAAAGQLASDAMIAREGTEEWQPLSAVLPDAATPAAPERAANDAPASEPEKWYEQPLVVIPSLVLCFPVGLAFLWKSRHFTLLHRIGWTVAVAMILLSLQIGNRDSSPSRSMDERESDKQAIATNEPAKSPQSEPLEYKLACLDAGHALSKSAPELAEYKRVIEGLAARFEITPNRVGDTVHALVKTLHNDHQIKATRLEMLLAAEKATAGGNAELVGKGDNALSSTLAAIATLMIDGKQSDGSDDAASLKAQSEGVVLRDTALYADKETVEFIEAAWDKNDATGEAAFERMEREGKTWMEPFDLHVEIQERGGPRDSVLVRVKAGSKGLKAGCFWVFESDVLPLSNAAAKWAADKSKAVSRAGFAHVLDGGQPRKVGAVAVLNFIELVAGLYEGTIPESAAKQCLVLRDSIGGTNPCDFQQVIDDYLIYEGVLTARDHFQFALFREPAFEAGYSSPMQLYKEIEGSGHHSGNPLYKGALVYAGMEGFTTRTGLVRQMPVFRVVNVQP